MSSLSLRPPHLHGTSPATGGDADATRVASPSTAESGQRLVRAVLAYLLAIVLIITLLPFRFGVPAHPRIALFAPVLDVISNVLLFAPLGFLYRLWRGKEHASPLRVLALGLVASTLIECTQLFEVERYPSPWDVLTNGLGAGLGALLYVRLERRLAVDARVVGRLSLELPLMGLVYLLIPLLWVDALAVGGDTSRIWPTCLIALFGASLLGAMQRHYFGPVRGVPARVLATAAGVWFLIGAFPALPRRPLFTLALAAGVSLLVLIRGHMPAGLREIERRFELRALREAAPSYAALLIVLPLAAIGSFSTPWHATLGIAGTSSDWTTIEILRLLERLAAFTLLGYMIAEVRGRIDRRFADALPRVLAGGLLAACATEAMQGFRPAFSASLLVVALAITAATYGGWLYHLQRDHVLGLLERR